MALVTEDGTGLSTAESYASVAEADTRLANLGLTIWAPLLTAEKEQALRRSTQYLEQAYRENWKGYRLHKLQALSWPRWSVMDGIYPVDSDSVPQKVKDACIDLAFKAAAGDLNSDLSQIVVREKVGPIETEYLPGARQTTRYYDVEILLQPFFCGSPNSMKVSRA